MLFLTGWSISRGANMQKYTFKRWPERKFLGLTEPEYIQAGDRKILCSGLWRLARHFNCLGEGFLSFSIGLAFGHFANPWAWTYFVFIVSLFTWRQRLDEKNCAENTVPISGESTGHGSSTGYCLASIEWIPGGFDSGFQ